MGGEMSFLGDIAGVFGAEKAEDAQYAAGQRAAKALKEALATGRTDLSPYMTQGAGAANILSRLYGLDGQPADMSAFTQSPDYQFNLSQGLGAIDKSAASRGGLYSGATMKAAQRFGSGLASQQFSDYFNRLSGLSGSGQNAATSLLGAGTNTAQGLGAIHLDQGQNAANNIMSQFQGWGNLANQAVDAISGGMGGGVGGGFSGAGALKSLFGM